VGTPPYGRDPVDRRLPDQLLSVTEGRFGPPLFFGEEPQ